MNRYLTLQKIVELQSFTKAAAALGYTQSSVSQMVAALEDELGMKLLLRSRSGIRLTPEGAELYPFLEKAALQYRVLQEKAREIRGLETGVIRMGTIASVSCHWMPQLIKGFQEQYPKVQFVLHQGDYSSIREWIRTGAVDFGFITPPAAGGLQTVVVKEGSFLAVLPQAHPLARQSVVSLADLAREPYILMEEGHYSEPVNAFRAAGLEPQVKYTMHDDYGIMTMVEAGLGVSILAELVLRRTAYRIACRPLEPPVRRTLAMGYKDRASLPIAAKYFIEYLLAHADELA